MRLLRYRVSRFLIHLGLTLMPPGRYKGRLLEVLWSLHEEVLESNSRDTSKHRQHTTRYEDLCQ